MSLEFRKNFLINVLYAVTLLGLIYILFKYVIGWFLPFIIGFAIAYLLKPITNWLTKFTRMKYKKVATFVIILFYLILVGLVILAVASVWGPTVKFVKFLPVLYQRDIEPLFVSLNIWLVEAVDDLSPETAASFTEAFNNLTGSLATVVRNTSGYLIGKVSGIAGGIPLFVITLVFSIASSIFISLDYNNISTGLLRQLPLETQKNLIDIKEFLSETIFKLIKAYGILMLITFVELCIGLLILRVDYAIYLAILTTVLDVLPLIGVGGILVPWAVIEIFKGDIVLGVGFLILWGVIYIVRSIMEPRVVSGQVGLHPLLTLTAMFAGYKLFGIIGFVIAPLTVLLVKYLNEKGKIKFYKR